MAIKDKDGNVYRLRGPNPIMQSQQEWDKKRVRLINLGWKSEVVHDEKNPIEEFKQQYNVVDIGEKLNLRSNEDTRLVRASEFIEELQETQEKPPEILSDTLEPEVDAKAELILKQKGRRFHCVPAVGNKSFNDDLYDVGYNTTLYGDKTIFNGIVLNESDLEISVWCLTPVTVNSIIYKAERAERWWRIINSKQESGGFLLGGIPSDSNPDFS